MCWKIDKYYLHLTKINAIWVLILSPIAMVIDYIYELLYANSDQLYISIVINVDILLALISMVFINLMIYWDQCLPDTPWVYVSNLIISSIKLFFDIITLLIISYQLFYLDNNDRVYWYYLLAISGLTTISDLVFTIRLSLTVNYLQYQLSSSQNIVDSDSEDNDQPTSYYTPLMNGV